MDPSWLPQTPPILYSKGLDICEFSKTIFKDVSVVMNPYSNSANAASNNAEYKMHRFFVDIYLSFAPKNIFIPFVVEKNNAKSIV